MSLGKNGIIKNIKSKAQISDSKAFFEFFVDLLKKNSKQKIVKVSNFGTFYTKNTPQRLGRNPKTKEEYALARTERKSGKGYHGFKFYYDPSVTLEDDLLRRDLTINAIAEDEDGEFPSKLLRCDVDEPEALPGLVDADH